MLIGMRRVQGAHSGENITEVMIPVLEEFDIASRSGFTIASCPSDAANNSCLQPYSLSLDFSSAPFTMCFPASCRPTGDTRRPLRELIENETFLLTVAQLYVGPLPEQQLHNRLMPVLCSPP
jgi:hypothetical protein